MVDEWVEDNFTSRVEDIDNLSLDEVQEWYEEQLREYDGNETFARRVVSAEFNEWVNSGADSKVKLLTIGAQDDPFNNGDVFIGYALAIPDDQPMRIAAVEMRYEEVDVNSMKTHFYNPYTPVEGEFNIRSAEPPVGDNAYHIEAVANTSLTPFEPEKDREERKEMVDEQIADAEIANIGEHLSLTNSDGWLATFGVDIRRISEAYVHQVRTGDSAARIVVQDDSFIDARDLSSDVTNDGEDEGLSGFANPELVEFGEGSFVDVYCSLATTDEGRVLMNAYGFDPINVKNAEQAESSSSSASEDNVGGSSAGGAEERTI